MVRKQTRVRKARTSGKLACGHFVQVGKQMVSVNGGPWKCIGCHFKRIGVNQGGE